MFTKGTTLSAGRPSAKTNKAATLASLADKGPTVRVNFDLDRDQHIKLKVYATKQGKSVKEVLTDFVAQLTE
ncbi:plasmid partition protein ParG [Xanthomonas phaseoli]|uniref:Chromosome partitioning protein ParB n=1 Tax=Xanthomonas manihotis TaxID=43353 RepID=A0A8I1XG08_XANMN|nr:plasmid partition protein ParG [Xanthomonas phaseoli]RWU13309.1 chromosome partitioning protein ParB [Xanthomonas phaseoli pv. manihotis str. CIO151]KUF21042.1 chromosome partitioning protein ParB [Xanthomonas phaseoli pv. manihotis]MBO9721940.1 chromosome partitioning protein ParB [Xanthomonas phaseoli pv. manihotis]MBO9757911.1 chromosome partitioning protein ParB [Xanthomonas phaseoli pv. manihotis]MBO9758659.1 chromosome partitioning protein ParB [Xanthomonas phaseoli pv. manihotis]